MFGRGIVPAEAGQYITGKTGGPGELSRILRKMAALWGVHLVTFAAWAVVVLALGPALTGVAVLLYAALQLYLASQEAESPPHWAIVVVLEVALLSLAWGWATELAEPATAAWWPAPFGQRVDYVNRYWRLAFALFAVGWLLVRRKAEFRLSNEITHPTYPPPLGVRPGWMGPISEDTEFAPPSDGLQTQPEVIERIVPRPLPVHANHRPTAARDGGNGRGIQTLIAPSGREIAVSDLATFVHGAYRSGTAFINVWKPRGWEYSHWHDVVSLLAVFGVTSEPIERQPTRLLADNEDEALARVRREITAVPI